MNDLFYSFVYCLVRMYTLKVRILSFIYHVSPMSKKLFVAWYVLNNIHTCGKNHTIADDKSHVGKEQEIFYVSSSRIHMCNTFTSQ